MKLQVKSLLNSARKLWLAPVLKNQQEILTRLRASQESQVLLSLKYKELLSQKNVLPAFSDIEFRSFSQNGEDGILLYIFSLIGTIGKKAVEICASDGIECNAANLIINHGWTGLLFDGNEELIGRGRQFYAQCASTWIWPPSLVSAWVTAENVNQLIINNGFQGEVDLLSLDMDGVDYWIWKAIECISPRVVVVEYQSMWGSDRAVTVPYRPDFAGEFNEYHLNYGGASLPAFVKLGREKGYRLVGCQRYEFNAFFMREGVGCDIFPEIDAAQCLKHAKTKHAIEHRLPQVIDRMWVEV